MATGATFAADISRWNAQTAENIEALARQTVQEVAQLVQSNTPVLTGFLWSSWQASIGTPPPPPENGGRPSAGQSYTADDGGASLSLVIATMRIGETFFYVNNAAYGMRLEHGFVGVDALGRNYNQQGRHFVANTLARWPQIVAEVAADLRLSP